MNNVYYDDYSYDDLVQNGGDFFAVYGQAIGCADDLIIDLNDDELAAFAADV
jgi:hypothetical protein